MTFRVTDETSAVRTGCSFLSRVWINNALMTIAINRCGQEICRCNWNLSSKRNRFLYSSRIDGYQSAAWNCLTLLDWYWNQCWIKWVLFLESLRFQDNIASESLKSHPSLLRASLKKWTLFSNIYILIFAEKRNVSYISMQKCLQIEYH